MTTSGLTNSTLTARQVANQAMTLIGALPSGGTMKAADAELCRVQMNFMLKSWQADGCNLWRDQDALITWPADTPSGELDPNFIDVLDVRWVQSGTYLRTLLRIERGEYNRLPNPIAAGSPTQYCVSRGRTTLTMRLWPVPQEETILKCDVTTIIQDVTTLDDNLDIPQMWLECAYYNLAARIMPIFGLPNPEISNTALQLYAAMRDYDRPGSVNMGPW